MKILWIVTLAALIAGCDSANVNAPAATTAQATTADVLPLAGGTITGNLTVAGSAILNALRIATGASNGYVLTSDGSGNAAWAPIPSPASGVFVYAADGTKLGQFFGGIERTAIVFADGSFAYFDFETGKSTAIINYRSGMLTDDETCSFDNANCTGDCYTSTKPVKNSLGPASDGYRKATDSSLVPTTDVVTLTHSWDYSSQTCVPYGGGTPATLYKLDTAVTLPAAMSSVPFAISN